MTTSPTSLKIDQLKLIEDGQTFENAAVEIHDGRFSYAGPQAAAPHTGGKSIDGRGWIAVPGYIDIQVNGAYGLDFTEQPEGLLTVAERLPSSGVVAFLPTFITSPLEGYHRKLLAVAHAKKADGPGARVLGAHLEGPFLDLAARGAHPVAYFREPTPENLACFDPIEAVSLVTLAVEHPDGLRAVAWLRERGVTVSIGHSAATAEQARQVFAAGVHYTTHLYNAMPTMQHRQPGLVGAALTNPQVRCGLIVDGLHSHPLMVDLAYRCKGAQGITLVTDCLAAMGMPHGHYSIGGQDVTLDESGARQSEGRLAGSVLRMDEAVRNMIAFTGCSLPEAVRMASLTPAETLGLQDRLGHVKTGYAANLALLDTDLHVEATFVDGRLAYATAAAAEKLNLKGLLDA
jgi:N-acetylglucosamine-6-phosphate deacetylase